MKSWNVVGVTGYIEVAKEILKALNPPVAIWLEGDIGSGKTTLTRYLIQELQAQNGLPARDQKIASPTYGLHHVHSVANVNVHHFDLYRLQSREELDEVGLWEALEEPNTIVIVEWPQLLLREIDFKGIRLIQLRIQMMGDDRRVTQHVSYQDRQQY